ncbi:hypothetical protein P4H27_00275 [Paenibacillus taichungensis]|uniref:hypothetical protein n=1 Tax=Paenibacillus taichungensis TaxID=484184 RepID=UPI002DBC566F|nr:hypothetical protein [Paenibacillus taichungensis]MEC0105367.1 hypothetical protein [Paenibacillus taichungensis]MEC0200443.1 hypothetical protein [Paenibacillus taichungensis]
MEDKIIENYALYSYERLRLLQPQLKVKGLYKQQNCYYIHCDDFNIVPINSNYTDMSNAFEKEIKIASCPIKLVIDLPNETQRINDREQKDVQNLVGSPFTLNDFNFHLSLNLPKKLPSIWVNYDNTNEVWEVMCAKILSNNQNQIVRECISKLVGYQAEIILTQTENIEDEFKSIYKNSSNITIAVSKHSFFDFSKELMRKWEEDEEVWLENKEKLFWSDADDFIQQEYNHSACFVNASFGETHDIRNYLTLFNEINLVLPKESLEENFYNSLGVNESELLSLIEMNKLKIVLPHSVNKYNTKFIEKVVSVNSKNLVFSRELACRTLRNQRTRNPYIFLPIETNEKSEFLNALFRLSDSLNNNENDILAKWVKNFAMVLSDSWSKMYESIEKKGALGTYITGLGPILHNTIESLTGNNYKLEIMEAANSIEWAAAQNAVLCPVGPLARNEENLAYLYSGVNNNWKYDIMTSPNLITDGILTISRHVPVLEIAEAFQGSEIDKLRNLIMRLSEQQSQEQMTEIIEQFNNRVKHYEKNQKRLDVWDVRGVTLDSIIEVTNSTIPFAGFITKQLGRIAEHIGSKNGEVETVLRRIEAKMSRTSPDVILVSRARDKIKDML